MGLVTDVAPVSQRLCSRPLCGAEAKAVLLFDYASGHVVLDWTRDVHDPNHLELCAAHAERFRPPNGWTLEDRRSVVSLTDAALSGDDIEVVETFVR